METQMGEIMPKRAHSSLGQYKYHTICGDLYQHVPIPTEDLA